MKKAIMYGAGNIGRGFIGQLFALSDYEICFIDVNESNLPKKTRHQQLSERFFCQTASVRH